MSKRLDFTNILNTKNEGLRKRILNTYELNKQDKKDILNNINKSGSSENISKNDIVYVMLNASENNGISSDIEQALLMHCYLLKAHLSEKLYICTYVSIVMKGAGNFTLLACSIDLNKKMYDEDKGLITIKERIEMDLSNLGKTWDDISFITEEEFYKID